MKLRFRNSGSVVDARLEVRHEERYIVYREEVSGEEMDVGIPPGEVGPDDTPTYCVVWATPDERRELIAAGFEIGYS